MKFTANRKELLAAARQAALIAPVSSPVRELECTLVELGALQKGLNITATNLEVTLKRTLPLLEQDDSGDGFAIHARLFAAMLEKLDGETVTIAFSGGCQLSIQSGSAENDITALSGKGYPRLEIPFPEDTVHLTKLPSLVQRSAFATLESSSQPLLRCIHLRFTKDGLRAVSSDGSCIMTAQGDPKCTGDISFLVLADSLEKLSKLCDNSDAFSVGTTGKNLVFLKEDFAFSARLVEGRYVDTDQILQSLQPAFTAFLDAEDLRRAVLSIGTMEPDSRLLLRFQDQQLEIRSTGTYGTAALALEIVPLTGQPSGEYHYAAHQLGKALRVLNGALTLGIAQQGLLTLSTEDTFYLQTALRSKTIESGRSRKKAA